MNCKICKNVFVEAFYGELADDRQQAFDAHLAGCENCAAAFREVHATLQIMSQREQPQADTAFLAGFWARLAPELEKPSRAARKNRRFRFNFFPEILFTQKWIWGIAGAAALLALGTLLGKYFFSPSMAPTQFAEKQVGSPPDARYELVAQRSQRYLERSKVLLLGLINAEPAETDSTVLILPYKKQLSRELVQEAYLLKQELSGVHQLRLQKLVADIEMILLQIANLEETQDLPAVEMIRSSVDRKGILLKINLEEMKTQSQSFKWQENANKHKKL
jgi:hypothetical protein